ncbi:MAG: Gldg family protein [Deltaproteobacteria bacterium]|nr:Gldg family protein [Deltaproteobacteria bacterium]
MFGKERYGRYGRFVAYMIVIVLVNLAGATLFFRWDLTENNIYSLSEASRRVVSTLSEPLTINVFFSKNLPSPYNNTETYLRDLLEEYSLEDGGRYFNYRFYDVSADEGDLSSETETNRELAQSYGINPIQIQAFESDEIKFQRAYMGLVMVHGDMTEKLPAVTSTDRLEYDLTTSMERLNNKVSALLRLKDKVKVKLYLSSSMEIVTPHMGIDGISSLPEDIQEIVDNLNRKNYGKLEFMHIDPLEEGIPVGELEKYNVPTFNWPELPQKDLKAGEGAAGIVMEHGEKQVNIPLISAYTVPLMGTYYELAAPEDLEETINEVLESLLDINEELGYVSDHGTQSLWGGMEEYYGTSTQDSLSNFREVASETYSIKEIDLSKEEIPEGINTLVIAGPKVKFTDYELYQIDQFLMKGKSLALFIDSFTEGATYSGQNSYGVTSYVPLSTGLERLLEHYGISVKASYVMDENCYKQQSQQGAIGGYQKYYFIPVIENAFINKELSVMRDIKGLVVSKVSPVEVAGDIIKGSGIRSYTLFSSSDRAWEMKDSISFNPYMTAPPSSESDFKSMPLAGMLEGEFTSYFKDKDIPERELDNDETAGEDAGNPPSDDKTGSDLTGLKAEKSFIAKGSPARIFVMGSSDVLKNYIIDSEGSQPNSVFVMNMLDYLNGREDTALMRGKENSYNPLEELSGGAKAFIKYFNIIGLPALVALFGVAALLRRQQRKKMIQAMFRG